MARLTLRNLSTNRTGVLEFMADTRTLVQPSMQTIGERDRAKLRQLWREFDERIAPLVQPSSVESVVVDRVSLDAAIDLLTRGGSGETVADWMRRWHWDSVARNALDHGIEPEPERASRGKPSAGRLVLRSRRGDQPLAIEIIDDGRGVDWQAVTRRAKELGGPMPSDNPPVSALFFGRGSLGWHFPGRRSSGATAPDSSASAAAPGRAAQHASITIWFPAKNVAASPSPPGSWMGTSSRAQRAQNASAALMMNPMPPST